MNNDPGSELFDYVLDKLHKKDSSRPRSTQKHLGPSELADPCDRKLAFKIARATGTNINNPKYAAWFGTAWHEWVKEALDDDPDFVLEKRLHIAGGIYGSGDALRRSTCMAIDWKTSSKSVLDDVRRNGPGPTREGQVQLYGMGWIRAGYPVKKVCIVFFPKGEYDPSKRVVWIADYDPEIAQRALDRLDRIEKDVGQGRKPLDFDKTAGHACTYCPFFSSVEAEESGTGCSGPLTKRPGLGPHGQFQ